MDAKTKAAFINSVAEGTKVPCPKCNLLNESDSSFCFSCGTPLPGDAQNINGFDVSQGEVFGEEEDQTMAMAVASGEGFFPEVQEGKSVFAQGLPAWDLEPPQVAIRRIRKK